MILEPVKYSRSTVFFFQDGKRNPQPDFATVAVRIIPGQVADTPRAPMKGLPDATDAVTLN